MNTAQRLKRLERMTATARPMTPARRAALYAQVLAKLEEASAGAPMPAADWSHVDAPTAAHRERLLRRIDHAKSNSNSTSA